MKFRVTMKDPDTLGDAVSEAVKADLARIEGLDEDDRQALTDKREEAVLKIASQWFKYGEYLTVEIDTDAQMITVCLAQ